MNTKGLLLSILSTLVGSDLCDKNQCSEHVCSSLHSTLQNAMQQFNCATDMFTPDSRFYKSSNFHGREDGYSTNTDAEEANWWFNQDYSNAFEIYDLNLLYPDDYYDTDHVSPEITSNYATISLYICKLLRGGDCESLLELGAASCFMTETFRKNNKVDIYAVEGALGGVKKCLARGIPSQSLLHRDLRLPLTLNRHFDMALCTEVAEHIEPPFSSQLVLNLVTHSDIIYFSFEDRTSGNFNHIHHNNEQPAKFWVNLFAFYGYEYVKLPESVLSLVEDRGGYVFYNKKKVDISSSIVDKDNTLLFGFTKV
jgi:hypothetical protein